MNEVSQLQITTPAADQNTGVGGMQRSSWFLAMAEAWGRALDQQADRIVDQSLALGDGQDRPADVTRLQAESLRMQFLSNASHTSLTSVGTALDTMARRQ